MSALRGSTLSVSRIHLYPLAEVIGKNRQSDVAERLEAVYSKVESKSDPVLGEVQFSHSKERLVISSQRRILAAGG